jgi:hypothetical protein
MYISADMEKISHSIIIQDYSDIIAFVKCRNEAIESKMCRPHGIDFSDPEQYEIVYREWKSKDSEISDKLEELYQRLSQDSQVLFHHDIVHFG